MVKLRNNGDTIVEVMIAISIIGLVIVGATISVNNSKSFVFASQVRQQAIQVLQNQMEMLKAANNDGIKHADTLCVDTSCSATTSNYFCIYADNTSSSGLKINIDTAHSFPSTPSNTLNCSFDYTGSSIPSNSGYFSVSVYELNRKISNFDIKNNYQYNGTITWTGYNGKLDNASLSYEITSQ